jgi:hypothetical protein
MDANDPQWRALLDAFTAWGEASARNGTPLPTDDELRTQARGMAGTRLPEQADADLLDELRYAFNTGRQPTRIDLQAVADALHQRGHHAYVEHTGGNTATLYAGRQVPDRSGDPRWSASAGPGWFEAPGRHKPSADASELSVGPDSDDTWAVTVPEHCQRSLKIDPPRLRRILMIVATLEGSRSCDGRQRSAGCGAADGQAGAVRRADRAGRHQFGGVPDRRYQPPHGQTLATRPNNHQQQRSAPALCACGWCCEEAGDIGTVPVGGRAGSYRGPAPCW